MTNQQNTIRISYSQFIILLFTFIVGASSLINASIVAEYARQDGWISSLIAQVIGVATVWLYVKLIRQHPGKHYPHMLDQVFGFWLGRAIALLYIFYLFAITAYLLRMIGDFVTIFVMPETPMEPIIILFLMFVLYCLLHGINVIARCAEILFPWIITLMGILLIFSMPILDLNNLQPMLEEGWRGVAKGLYPIVGIPYLDLVIFLYFIHHVEATYKIPRAMLWTTAIGGSLITLITSIILSVIGANYTGRQLFAGFMLARRIHIGEFLQRVEVIVGGFWILSMFIKICICYYALLIALKHVTGSREYTFFLVPSGIILVLLSLTIAPNTVYFKDMLTHSWTPLVLLYGIVFPLLTLGVGYFRKSSKKRRDWRCTSRS
ncbi:GerAB/ArcD/ProY family transporter [Marinicrinis sediminis]|uniref:Endospore germination permease n=1 Tax=Marinicrinis sediminis TaxID=1652465 RepID=A0ABW5R8L4_9BACL